MEIGYIGLGKMGYNMTERLVEKGHAVIAYDPDTQARGRAKDVGADTVGSIPELVAHIKAPRTVWIMVPHQAVDDVLHELLPLLEKGDTVIEGGNSPYKETIKRGAACALRGLRFLDAGVSGGPAGAKSGACLMVGGEQNVYIEYKSLFKDLSVDGGCAYAGPCGAGHFVKMIHNGIEYGMMQAIAEGFDILKNAPFKDPLPLHDIASLYNHGSVIQSRLVGWLRTGYEKHGINLEKISGSANASGEGLWTTETAHALNVPAVVIEASVQARTKSQTTPNYQGKVVSVLRNEFGGHDVSN